MESGGSAAPKARRNFHPRPPPPPAPTGSCWGGGLTPPAPTGSCWGGGLTPPAPTGSCWGGGLGCSYSGPPPWERSAPAPLVGLISDASSRPVWGESVRVREARGGVRSGAVGWWVFVVRAEPRRAPRAAGRRLCRRRALPRQPPGVMVEEGSGEPPPGGGTIVTPRHGCRDAA